MGFKDELKKEIRNAIRDVEKEVNRTWIVDYKGHSIKIVFKMKEEQLIIDGVTVASKKRNNILSHMTPYSKMSGTIELENGHKHHVFVKLGGYRNLNCIVKVDKETILDDSQQLEMLPWNHKEKIVPFLQQQVQIHHKIIDESMPDDLYVYDENQPKLSPGFSDLLIDKVPTPFYAKKLLKLFKEQIENPNNKTRKATYEKIIFDQMAIYTNEFIELLLQAQLEETLLQNEALWLLEHAAHREVVKFSIIVLGCTDCEKYKELLFTIGLHEEFTAYVLFALKNGIKESNTEIWRLAQSVHGWGKVAAVKQLDAPSEEIKHWFRTKGCESSISHAYLAYVCAEKGELDEVLYENTISKELYDGASLIIEGLLHDMSTEGMDDYSDAGLILSRFVYHSSTHCKTMDNFYVLLKINEYINVDSEVWEERFQNNWRHHERNTILEAIEPLIKDRKWADLAMNVINHDYDYHALEIVRFFELDVTKQLFVLLEKYPLNDALYFVIMGTNNRSYIEELCQFAELHLSLTNFSYEEQSCLQYIVQSLHEFEGVGLPLIQAALESNDGSLQYYSLTVLDEWSPTSWKNPAILAAIQHIATTTKDKEDRQLAKYLLTK